MQDVIYSAEPTVAVFADGAGAQARLAGIAVQAGARVTVRGELAQAINGLNDCAVDAALVELTTDHGPVLDRLLCRLNDDAAAGRMSSVVLLPIPLIDVVATQVEEAGVDLLCDASELEGVGALSLAIRRPTTLLFEERGDASSVQLQLRHVREEVARIARVLANVAGAEERGGAAVAPAPPPGGRPGDEPGAGAVRQAIRARRLRDQYFDPELFADPAWDMLLDLMLARMEGRAVAVSSLCIAAAVPPTTALRWIKRLVDDGLLVRTADPLDGRRVFIDLSEGAALAMMRYLRAVPASGRSDG